MSRLVSCLCPTFNRAPKDFWLLEEAVESFLRQDYPHRELIVCNDAPGQTLRFEHPQVRVFNVPERFDSLSSKLIWMINQARGDVFCRWDDDDISLPHRLSYSLEKMGSGVEWRAGNRWYNNGSLSVVEHPGNTHAFSIWTRGALDKISGYPPDRSGDEDKAFTAELIKAGFPRQGEIIPVDELFYIYRWNTGSVHLSGSGGGTEKNLERYRQLGEAPILKGEFTIRPHWKRNYVAATQQATRIAKNLASHPDAATRITGYFDWPELYLDLVRRVPNGGRIAEVGCYHGKSIVFLANAVKKAGKRIQVIGVDYGRGIDTCPDFLRTGDLLASIRAAGVFDVCSIVAAESTQGAALFADRSFDAVFIDAGHDYQSVRADLQAWLPKVKVGGWIGGHDYRTSKYPNVMRAVDEFFGRPKGECGAKLSKMCWEIEKSAEGMTPRVATVNLPVPAATPPAKQTAKPPANLPSGQPIQATLKAPTSLNPPLVYVTGRPFDSLRFSLVMATYDDFQGVFQTIQAARMMHGHRLAEIIVVDNHPSGRPYPADGKNLKGHSEHTESICRSAGARYIRMPEPVGTAMPRDRAIREASTDYVICTDAHNLFPLGSLDALAKFYADHPNSPDFIGGPMVNTSLTSLSTNLRDGWGGGMWGKWETRKAELERGEPFETWGQILGAFSVRRESWLGFNPAFRGFGGCESYLPAKYKLAGRKVWCVPGFQWVHRWGDPDGKPYPLQTRDKARNYAIGLTELGIDLTPFLEHFRNDLKYPVADMEAHIFEAERLASEKERVAA